MKRLRRALRLERRREEPAAWLIVGLGNPGERYSRNRHNVGAWTVNELARRLGVKMKAEGRSIRIGYGELAGERVAVVRPRTYMNESGRAVAQALRASGAPLERTIIVYDELDLPLGAVRLRAGGGAGGHNGLKSIIAEAAAEFVRVRLGIGRPIDGDKPTRDPDLVADYVLTDPVGEERAALEETTRYAADAIEAIVAEGVERASTRFARRGTADAAGGSPDAERGGV